MYNVIMFFNYSLWNNNKIMFCFFIFYMKPIQIYENYFLDNVQKVVEARGLHLVSHFD